MISSDEDRVIEQDANASKAINAEIKLFPIPRRCRQVFKKLFSDGTLLLWLFSTRNFLYTQIFSALFFYIFCRRVVASLVFSLFLDLFSYFSPTRMPSLD